MKNVWKWILGIVILLAVLAVPFVLHYALGMNFVRGFGVHGPMMNGFGWNGHGMGHGFERFGPMMGGRGGFGFFGPFALFGGLLKLAFFGLLLVGAYWLGRRNARIALDPAPVAPAPSSAPEAAPTRGRKVAKKE